MYRLRFTTLVEAPLTVAFDVARTLGRPWPWSLTEVDSVRPWSDVYRGSGGLLASVTHTRSFHPTGAGTLVEEQLDWRNRVPGPPGRLLDQTVVRRHVVAAMQAHQDLYAAAAARRADDVVQVVGAALVDHDRVLVAQRGSGPLAGLWEFPGGKVERGEDELAALVRECQEELGVQVAPQAFLGEVPLDGVVAGGVPGASSLRVWWGRVTEGEPVDHEHTELRWVPAEDLEALDWIPADRPLLPAVRDLLARLG
ncbi:(deoxy)nucleoside triphosphate pyrophosphohydrolase [Modestobacter sp. Leaf380]|uniref:(deoxy)nucleoside triphosphate pyrophosphohydrolase n=1 Tax=Modestobacter sp. Leaf380 TaxID=1736356 RepID=UPI0006F6950A|nr:(deoxy)nucleoside triphosphate pyrophosphohydrolase [Modestobacter sp. Leaf380]KQS68328.1 NUDIX hydrolase [Modestobacter sp. Leaf380]